VSERRTSERGAAVEVRVPASSANLGPGYDSFGLALQRHDLVRARRLPGELAVQVCGVGQGVVPETAEHLVVRCALAGFQAMDEPAPGLEVVCTNNIPHGGGQGSSAAAIVAGLLVARGLTPHGAARLPDEQLLDLASRIEGHPDNVAAALLGGFTLAWIDEAGRARAVRRRVHPDIRAMLFTAATSSSTAHSRGLLPDTVPHADAAANLARAGLLVHALSDAPALLFEATYDLLHQPYRATGQPATAALVAALRADGFAAMVSGAGPSVLVLGTELPDDDWPAERAVGAEFERHELGVDPNGAVVTPG
jgi:homoserine kinase